MLEFQSKYFPCIKQASRFAMFHCTWIEPCLAGLACTHSSLSNYIRLPHFMCCSVCRTMFDSAYTYNDKNLKLTSLFLTHTPPKSGLVHFFKLFPKRDAHTLWKRSDGIQLLGGRPFPLGNTSEVVTSSGSHKGFDLKYDIVYECYLNI